MPGPAQSKRGFGLWSRSVVGVVGQVHAQADEVLGGQRSVREHDAAGVADRMSHVDRTQGDRMNTELEQKGQELAADVLQEAIEEVTGHSSRKWAIVLVTLVFGIALAAYWIRTSNHQGDDQIPQPDINPLQHRDTHSTPGVNV